MDIILYPYGIEGKKTRSTSKKCLDAIVELLGTVVDRDCIDLKYSPAKEVNIIEFEKYGKIDFFIFQPLE